MRIYGLGGVEPSARDLNFHGYPIGDEYRVLYYNFVSFHTIPFSMSPDLDERINRIQTRDTQTIARTISALENYPERNEELLNRIYPDTGSAWRIGVTGPPGSGKSTLVSQLVSRYREKDKSVAVLAVDPSSTQSGGSVLGDRIRMNTHFEDSDVFIRSLASRGRLGGLSRVTQSAADILDAAGFDMILIETVGVGQGETDISLAADTVVVVLTAEAGDSIQFMKAGLMEIAHIFCINKADREGTDRMTSRLKASLRSGDTPSRPDHIPVLQISAREDEGLGELVEALETHRKQLQHEHTWQDLRRQRLEDRVREYAQKDWEREFWTPERKNQLQKLISDPAGTSRTPRDILERLHDRQ